MKLLLTSSGVSNPSIEDALVDLLGKPIADSSALVVPTAIYPFPDGPGGAWRAISGQSESPFFSGLGWKSLGVLELTALPSIKEESWVPKLRETDVQEGSLTEDDFLTLSDGYTLLRKIDHNLRLIVGRSTRLPDPDHLIAKDVAKRMGFDCALLHARLIEKMKEIRAAYNRILD